MSSSFLRFLRFGFAGVVCLMPWACAFGALLELLTALLAPYGEGFTLLDLLLIMRGMAILTCVPAFFAFGWAGKNVKGLRGRHDLLVLAKQCIFGSFVGAILCAVIAAVVLGLIDKPQLFHARSPLWGLGVVAGLFLGYHSGLIVGFVRGVWALCIPVPLPSPYPDVAPIAEP